MSWGDAARFANWLTNGQPSGAQGPGTTETGSYTLNGATQNSVLNAVTRNSGGRYFIPTTAEWYKAAYYDPTKGGPNYWHYAMRTDSSPYSAKPPGTAAPNSSRVANFFQSDGDSLNNYDDGYAVTGSQTLLFSQNYLSDVGAYVSAPSYYGTFDQGGNLVEWTEGLTSNARIQRGGSWIDNFSALDSEIALGFSAQSESGKAGFRISEVPEPATLTLFGLAALAISRPTYRRKGRSGAPAVF